MDDRQHPVGSGELGETTADLVSLVTVPFVHLLHSVSGIVYKGLRVKIKLQTKAILVGALSTLNLMGLVSHK